MSTSADLHFHKISDDFRYIADSQMESFGDSTFDLISNLPDELIENILVDLPLRDAARTSVLSTKWRRAWETLPELAFDYSFSCCRDIDCIMKFLSEKGIQARMLSIWKDGHYKVPPYLFPCTELKHLHLSRCSVEPPATFNGLENLVTLKLRNVVFNHVVVENFFSKFPLLESLILQNCGDFRHLSIRAPKLKYLCLESCFKSIDFRETWQLKVAHIRDLGVRTANVNFGLLGRGVNMVELFDFCLGTIEYLEIGCYFIKILVAGHVLPRLVANFKRLKTVIFGDICFQVKTEVECDICFLRSAPYLQHFSIRVCDNQNGDTEGVMRLLKVLDHDDTCFDQLRFVEMKSCRGTEPEIEFVKLMLAKSPLLEQIQFHNARITKEFRIVKQTKTPIFRNISFEVKAEVECAMCILRSAPYLQHISFMVCDGTNCNTDGVMGFLKVLDHGDISFDQLQSVEMQSCEGTEPEVEFVKLVLAKSPLLETMRIQFDEVSISKELRIVKQINLFRRASKAAVVEFF